MLCKNNLLFIRPIEAILPAYDHRGSNVCYTICTKGTSRTKQMNLSNFIRRWFFSQRIDFEAQRIWASQVLGQRNLNPIVINENITLIPVKIREAIGAKDGCYGYVRLDRIESIDPGSILLKSGVRIFYLSSEKTIRMKITNAKLLQYTYVEELMIQHRIYKSTAL